MAARNHPAQVERRGPVDEVDDRATPFDLFTHLDRKHRFTVDVAAAPHNTKCARYFTREEDGLHQSWAGESVWCNPPFSDIKPWVQKAWAEHRTATGIVMLLPANRTEQRWWNVLVEPFRDRGGGVPADGVSAWPDPVHEARPDTRGPERATAFRLRAPDLDADRIRTRGCTVTTQPTGRTSSAGTDVTYRPLPQSCSSTYDTDAYQSPSGHRTQPSCIAGTHSPSWSTSTGRGSSKRRIRSSVTTSTVGAR